MIGLTINQKIAEAMKAHDEIRLSTLRLLSSAFNYERIAKQHELNEEEELVVVMREAKKRKEAIEAFRAALGKNTSSTQESLKENLDKEQKELEILEEYLPQQMSDEELARLVDEAIASCGAKLISDMGKVIGLVKAKTKGAAESARIAEVVKQKLAI